MEKEEELAPWMLFQEPSELRSCHWKAVDGEPSGSTRLEREAESVLPSCGVPEICKLAVAGLSIFWTLEEVVRESCSVVPC